MPTNWRENNPQRPSLIASLTPLAVLTFMLYVVISLFGSDAISGGNQVALIAASITAVAISVGIYRCGWNKIEEAMIDNIKASASAIIILLLIGALSGTWMVSGVVPTMILYGLEVLNPYVFLVSTSIICAVVSIMTGSSWTTIATIGVALMGVGSALGFSEGWIAGAIISGAYFGDKLSMLSDTTIMASTTVGVRIFEHIRYMFITTIPTFIIALTIFLVAGFVVHDGADVSVDEYTLILNDKFNISPWLLSVPVMTMVLIARRVPAMITLSLSVLLSVVALVVAQPEIMAEIVGVPLSELDVANVTRAAIMSCYGSTSISTQSAAITELISTRGMEGMMNTIWLIICAMCFGGVMVGSGMLQRITSTIAKHTSGAASIVGTTLCGGIFFNLCTADQYISIILTGRLFKGLYMEKGYEARLLSRSVEDSASVTSVLVPWNSCGMAQAGVLGVSTWVYLPYCFFNILSPVVSFTIAAIGYKIFRTQLTKK
ncbi:MAG: Na+/H+ antiporter NhaC family protein [Rikenellaceae bacterium]